MFPVVYLCKKRRSFDFSRFQEHRGTPSLWKFHSKLHCRSNRLTKTKNEVEFQLKYFEKSEICLGEDTDIVWRLCASRHIRNLELSACTLNFRFLQLDSAARGLDSKDLSAVKDLNAELAQGRMDLTQLRYNVRGSRERSERVGCAALPAREG